MWAPPGKKANADLWRWDMAQKSFLPPGEQSSPKGTQVEMPQGYQGNEPRGFHMMASPAGTQAPVDHINFTPETGEVSGRGALAPMGMLNYTLMPSEALQPQGGMGGGQEEAHGYGAMGEPVGEMGAGAVGALDAFGAPPQFAGAPPLAGSPNMQGPSPTTNRAAPQWGGGGQPFNSRMGMGQSEPEEGDVFGDVDPTRPAAGTTATTTTTTSTAGDLNPDTQQPYDPQHPMNINGQRAKPGDTVRIVYGTDGKPVVYMIFESMGEYGTKPTYRYDKGTSTDKAPLTNERSDGTIDVIDLTQNPPKVTNVGTPDPNLKAKVEADKALAAINLEIKKLELEASQGASSTAREEARLKLDALRAQASTAQSNADRAAIEAGMAGKPPQATPPGEIIAEDGTVWIPDPNGSGVYVSTGLRKAAGEWKEYTDPSDQMVKLYNPTTRQSVTLHPADPYKQYPPQKSANGKWIQWDPGTKTFKTVYTEDPEYTTQWSGDELIAVNKNNPSDVKSIWKKTPTRAETDTHDLAVAAIAKAKQDLQTGKITAAEARVTMEKTIQDLMYPKAEAVGSHGTLRVPGGTQIEIEDWDPGTGERSTRTVGERWTDPRVSKMLDDIDKFIADWNKDPNAPATPPPAATPPGTPPPAAAATTPTTTTTTTTGGGGPKPTETVGSLLAPGQTGVPGVDPRLSGGVRPPTKITRGDGTVDTVDAEGNVISSVKPGGFGEEFEEAEGLGEGEGSEEVFDEGENAQFGFGNERKMGAGMAAGATGWAPRPGTFAPATGPGFLGSGAEDDDAEYDREGNPIMEQFQKLLGGLGGALPSVTMPKLPTGGHTPPIDIKMPGQNIFTPPPPLSGGHKPGLDIKTPTQTDQGTNWNPGLKKEVVSRVNEPIGEINKWPRIEETEPSPDPLVGTEGGFDQPEIDPYDIINKEPLGPTLPTDEKRWNPKEVKDISHILGEGGTSQEDWQDLEDENGMGRAAGQNVDPEAQRMVEEERERMRTLGVGQEPAPGMMPPSAGVTPPMPPQGPGGEQPPAWLLALLKTHPELLQMAGLDAGGAPSGGASPLPTPPPGGPPPAGGPAPADGTPPTPSAGWQPPTPPPAPTGAPPVPGAADQMAGPPPGGPPPMGGPEPVAPSPEGAPMSPPLPPEDVAGIGHRFGQPMSVGEPQHSGVDLQAPEGTPTNSPVDGFVQAVEDNPQGLGVTVVIRGMDGSEHRLGHLKSTSAYPGLQVARGQNLGSPVGTTGMTTGAHLHWGVKDGEGQPADPTQALGPMANMPPVPGTEMMGPPGGVGGGAQVGQPQMGGGQEPERIIPGFSRPERGTGNIAPGMWMPSDQMSGGRERSLLDLQNMGKVSIDPMNAFGTGAENVPPGGGGSPGAMPMKQPDQSIGQMMAQMMSPRGGPPQPGAPPQQNQGAPPGGENSPAMAGLGGGQEMYDPGQQTTDQAPFSAIRGSVVNEISGRQDPRSYPGSPEREGIQRPRDYPGSPEREAEMGGGQDSKKKGKKKKAGWTPKKRVGAGQPGEKGDWPALPGYTQPRWYSHTDDSSDMFEPFRGGRIAGTPQRRFDPNSYQKHIPTLDPMQAFGTGQEMDSPAMSMLRQMLQQQWQQLQQSRGAT